jgi:hypothetical protein
MPSPPSTSADPTQNVQVLQGQVRSVQVWRAGGRVPGQLQALAPIAHHFEVYCRRAGDGDGDGGCNGVRAGARGLPLSLRPAASPPARIVIKPHRTSRGSKPSILGR